MALVAEQQPLQDATCTVNAHLALSAEEPERWCLLRSVRRYGESRVEMQISYVGSCTLAKETVDGFGLFCALAIAVQIEIAAIEQAFHAVALVGRGAAAAMHSDEPRGWHERVPR